MFEGSCALIPVKVVANYCKKLADEFIPELVETLASEMNPDTVCTVAGKYFYIGIDIDHSPLLGFHTNLDIDLYNVSSLVISINIIFLSESLT